MVGANVYLTPPGTQARARVLFKFFLKYMLDCISSGFVTFWRRDFDPVTEYGTLRSCFPNPDPDPCLMSFFSSF
jgi:hypothetical protein